MDGSWATFRRAPAAARIHGPFEMEDGSFAHPFLAAAGGIFAHWSGWESFHAGAVARDGRALMLFGDKGAGKSTAMAWLALHGWDVLADDLVVVAAGRALAGPRCLDLRLEGRDLLGLGDRTSPVRGGDRHRLELPARVAPAVELVGSVMLGVGPAATRRAGPGERLMLLRQSRAISLPSLDPHALVDLVALPMVVLDGPLELSRMVQLEQALCELAAG